VRGADAVAVADGGQPLHVAAQEAGECLRLGLAQLGELRCHVGDGTVVLTELVTAGSTAHAGGIALGSECPGENRSAVLGCGGLDLGAVPLLPVRHPGAGEVGHRLLPRRGGQEAQSAHSEVVVGLVEGLAAGLGEGEPARGAASSTRATAAGCARLHRSLL